MIEWHRHQRVPIIPARMRLEGFHQPLHQPGPLVELVPILEADDRLAHLALRPIPGPRPLEMPLAIGAVRANEIRFLDFQRGKGKAALPAKRSLDPRRLGLARLRPRKGQIQGAPGPLPRAGSGEMEG
jgi:hypothetical protein